MIARLSLDSGGPAAAVASLAKAQRLRGMNVQVITPESSEVVALNSPSPSGLFEYRNPDTGGRRVISFIRSLNREVSIADVVHVHGVWDFAALAAMWLAYRQRKAFVVSMHGVYSTEALRDSRIRKAWARFFVADRLLLKSSALIATGRHEASDLYDFHPAVEVIHHGIEADCSYARSRQLRRIGSAPRIGFLGRIHPFKGIDELIEACESLRLTWPDLSLRIAGPVAPQYACRGVPSFLRQRPWIEYQGVVLREQKYEFLRELDVLALPSRFENFGLVVGEALAVGTPVVVTSRSAWDEVEARGVGVSVEPTASGIADGVTRVLSDDDIRHTALVNGPTWIRSDFTWNRAAESIEVLYVRILARRAGLA